MKIKIEVKSWNNYPSSPTHIPLEGEGAYSTYIAQRTIIHGCEIVQWDHLIPKIIIVSENKPI